MTSIRVARLSDGSARHVITGDLDDLLDLQSIPAPTATALEVRNWHARRAMRASGGNRCEAARTLGVAPVTLYRWNL